MSHTSNIQVVATCITQAILQWPHYPRKQCVSNVLSTSQVSLGLQFHSLHFQAEPCASLSELHQVCGIIMCCDPQQVDIFQYRHIRLNLFLPSDCATREGPELGLMCLMRASAASSSPSGCFHEPRGSPMFSPQAQGSHAAWLYW